MATDAKGRRKRQQPAWEPKAPTLTYLRAYYKSGAPRRLSESGRLVYLALCYHVNDQGRAWPSLTMLQEMTGLSRQGVVKGLADIEREGLITRDREGRGRRTTYCLTSQHSELVAGPLVNDVDQGSQCGGLGLVNDVDPNRYIDPTYKRTRESNAPARALSLPTPRGKKKPRARLLASEVVPLIRGNANKYGWSRYVTVATIGWCARLAATQAALPTRQQWQGIITTSAAALAELEPAGVPLKETMREIRTVVPALESPGAFVGRVKRTWLAASERPFLRLLHPCSDDLASIARDAEEQIEYARRLKANSTIS